MPVWKREIRKAGLNPNSPTEASKRFKKDHRLAPKDRLGDLDIDRLARKKYSQVSNGNPTIKKNIEI